MTTFFCIYLLWAGYFLPAVFLNKFEWPYLVLKKVSKMFKRSKKDEKKNFSGTYKPLVLADHWVVSIIEDNGMYKIVPKRKLSPHVERNWYKNIDKNYYGQVTVGNVTYKGPAQPLTISDVNQMKRLCQEWCRVQNNKEYQKKGAQELLKRMHEEALQSVGE